MIPSIVRLIFIGKRCSGKFLDKQRVLLCSLLYMICHKLSIRKTFEKRSI